MHSSSFQLNKVKRLLRTPGQSFTFTRTGVDRFGEPDGTTESFEIIGVYHESPSNSMYSVQQKADSATIWPKSFPMMLCLWEDAKNLQPDDIAEINGKKYKIGEIRNLEVANLIADVTLEEVQDIGQ